jgi:hypothetical protein
MPARLSLRTGGVIDIPAVEARLMQAAAAEAIERFGRR